MVICHVHGFRGQPILQNGFLRVRLRGTHRTRVHTSIFQNTQKTFGGTSGEEPMTRIIRASRLVGSGKTRSRCCAAV